MKESKADVVYREVKKKICSGELKPKNIINESVLAEQFNVSKTPVRDALTALSQEGFLIKFPRVGYYIKELSHEDFHGLLQLRYIVECGLIRYIISSSGDHDIMSLYDYTKNKNMDCQTYDEENIDFHLALAELSGNRYIVQQMRGILNMNTRWTSGFFFDNAAGDPHARHRELVSHLLGRDLEAALEWERREMIWADDKEPYFVK